MSGRLFHVIMAVLGLCSGTACTSDADEYVQTSEQQSSGFVTPARSAAIDHGTTYSYQTEEVWCQRDANRIYGVAYVPEGIPGRMPMVIYSHGFGGSHSGGATYARALAARGYMVYCFDFCGATSSSRSDGATTDMSIRTEESDLRAVIGHFAEDSRVDASRIYLVGASQGGMVTAMTAADYPDMVRAAVLIYPALVIPDDVHEWYPRREDIPETFSLWGVTLGSIYATDACDYDIYTELPKFQKDVLIIHGTADNIAPISYSERMVERYASGELKRIEGAGHGFYGQQQTQAIDWMLDFLNTEEQKAAVEDELQDEGADANVISADILDLPSGYRQAATQQGRVVRLDYQTTSYATGQPMQKYALVYLPYGYDEGTTSRYNVLYIMHGGGGSQATYLGGVGQNSQFKNILDNMIEHGDCQPCIVVAPTFYLSGDGDTSVAGSGVAVEQFPTELADDLIPAVEGTFRTYATVGSRADLRRSRNHRAFGGFSMGSVCTWWTFTKALDLFRYYIPTSGDCWALGTQAGRSNPMGTAEYLAAAVTEQHYTSRDFFIHVMTGSDDIAEPMLTPQTEAMKQLPQFSFGTDKRQHNFYYAVLPGATHTSSYAFQYAYNALLHLWKNEPDSDDTTGIKPVKM